VSTPTSLKTRQNGAAIRALRRESGEKVSVLATASGLHTQALVNIENGSRQASWEALNRLARALGVPLAAITRDPPPGLPAEDVA
jgi:transcriptional regulator with XRE-family HTH domain